jgi:zinc ribbon protein
MPPEPGLCSACNQPLPEGASFCPSCGRRVGDDGELVLQRVEPRLFGAVPPSGAFVLGIAALAAALVAFATGRWLVGLALILLSVALLGLFAEAARRFSATDPVAGATMAVARRVRAWSGFAAGSASAWSRARSEVVPARRELASILDELERAQRELGGAAYREDAAEIERLRARMHELEERAGEREAVIRQALDRARRRVGDERLAIQPTEVVRHPGAGSGSDEFP